MIRLTITLFHTAIAASTTTGGVWFLLQAVACKAWEMGFYQTLSVETSAWLLSAWVVVLLGGAHLIAVWAWLVGSRAGGITTILITGLLTPALPALIGLPLLLSGGLVFLDLLVSANRAQISPGGQGDAP